VLDGDDDDLFGALVGAVIDKVRVASRHQLSDALDLLLPPA
jgi:hypothetical protein